MSDKLKHISGTYKLLPDSPTPEDIVYYCKSNRKKTIKIDDLIKYFGEDKSEIIKKSLTKLQTQNLAIPTEEGVYKISY